MPLWARLVARRRERGKAPRASALAERLKPDVVAERLADDMDRGQLQSLAHKHERLPQPQSNRTTQRQFVCQLFSVRRAWIALFSPNFRERASCAKMQNLSAANRPRDRAEAMIIQ